MKIEIPTRCAICRSPLPPGGYRCLRCGRPCTVTITPLDVGAGRFGVFDLRSNCCHADAQILSQMTCGRPTCHEAYVQQAETEFGKYKKVVDETTGAAHRVPTRHLIEKGLRQQDLPRYPLWVDAE